MGFLSQRRGALAELARHLSVAPAYLSQMAAGVRPIQPQLVPQIEDWTGLAVRRWAMRPDDWHLIWPELVGADGAPPVPGVSAPAAATEAAPADGRMAA